MSQFYNTSKPQRDVGKDTELYKTDSSCHPAAKNLVLPPVNVFASWVRNKPHSGINNSTLFSANSQIDYYLNPNGYTKRMLLDINVTNNNANPINIFPLYFIDRIEIMDSSGSIGETIYGDNMYLEKVHQPLDYAKRIQTVEGFSVSNYNGIALAAGASQEFVLHIPCWLDAATPKLNSIMDRMLVRVYFSPNGTDTPTSLYVTSCDILTEGILPYSELEGKETRRKRKDTTNFRFLGGIRASQESLQMNPSSQYDIRLTSGSGLCAFLLVVVRANPIAFANINTFVPLSSIELLDKDSVIVGIHSDNVMIQGIVNQAFDGDILNYKNIYTIPFCTSVTASKDGGQTGFYQLTSNEIVRIFTPSTLTAGNYTVNIYSFEHQTAQIKNGELKFYKN
jgi:hypothetical protein